MASVSNDELRAELQKYGIPIGPITSSTRSLYLKKLDKLRSSNSTVTTTTNVKPPPPQPQPQPQPVEIPTKVKPTVIAADSTDEEENSFRSKKARKSTTRSESKLFDANATVRQSPSPIPGVANIRPSTRSKTPPAVNQNDSYSVKPTSTTITKATTPAKSPLGNTTTSTYRIDSYLADDNIRRRHHQDFSASLIDKPFSNYDYSQPAAKEENKYGIGYPVSSSFSVPSAYSSVSRRPLYSSTTTRQSLYDHQPTRAPIVSVPSMTRKRSEDSESLSTDLKRRWSIFREQAHRKLKETAAHFGFGDQDEDSQVNSQLYGKRFGTSSLTRSDVGYGRHTTNGQLRPSGVGGSSAWAGSGVQNARRWWHLTDGASKVLLFSLLAFLLFITTVYLATAHKARATRIISVVKGAFVDTVVVVYNHMILPIVVILLIVGAVMSAIWYKKYKWHKAAEEQRQIFEMVEKIITVLKRHYEECLADNNRQPYLAVPHVRDMLIPPSKRKNLLAIWDKAVQYLNENESRIRTENQIISGEEFMVWRWLQVAGANATYEEKVWQGHATDGEQITSAAPVPYYECLKLRGLFDPDLESDDDWQEHIQDALLEKLGPKIRVLHIAIENKSKDGCVYMKLASKEEAGRAMKTLHGSWFDGRLVTVKYLKLTRYHERFPDAAKAAFPLTVKKARNSLQH